MSITNISVNRNVQQLLIKETFTL